jgi:hypothetical protein
MSYRQEMGLSQCDGAALIHKSGECLCGAYKPKAGSSLEEIAYWFPKTGEYIRSLEREARSMGKPYCEYGKPHLPKKQKPVGPLCQGCELFREPQNEVPV